MELTTNHMSRKTPYYKLRCRVQTIQDSGIDVGLDSNAQGHRVTNKVGNRNLSDRLNITEMNVWLDGFITGRLEK